MKVDLKAEIARTQAARRANWGGPDGQPMMEPTDAHLERAHLAKLVALRHELMRANQKSPKP